MKSAVNAVVLAVVVLLLAGCATTYPIGTIYTEVKLPLTATGEGTGKKMGEAECVSILSLIATGDCSIEAAKKNGKITKVTSVDWSAKNILGVIGNYKVVVYGD